MSVWKEAFWLATFELKHSYRESLIRFGILIFAFMLVVPDMPDYFEQAFMGVDFQFLFIFIVFGNFFISKPFKVEKVNGEFFVSPHLITLNKLPISRKTIVKYRFISYFIVSFFFNCLFLIGLYFLSPIVRDTMTPSVYAVFSIIWLCYSIYIGAIQLLFEVKFNRFIFMLVLFFILGPVFLIVDTVLFYKIYTNGLVHWVIMIANHFPVIASLLSILLAVVGWNFWMRRMRLRMERTDYV